MTGFQEWQTPAWLFGALNERFRFSVDAAALSHNALVPSYFGPDHRDTNRHDGLAAPWGGERVFCNPPWHDVRPWCAKAIVETAAGCAVAVLLVPASTCTAWWHDLVMPSAAEVWLIRGRVDYYRPGFTRRAEGHGPRNASAVVVFRCSNLPRGSLARSLARGPLFVSADLRLPQQGSDR